MGLFAVRYIVHVAALMPFCMSTYAEYEHYIFKNLLYFQYVVTKDSYFYLRIHYSALYDDF
jgi:hypothetical protein